MRLFSPESAAPWIVLLSVVSVVVFASIVAIARRRRSYATVSVALLAAAYAGVALASCVSLWMFSRTLEEMSRSGGGIRTVSFGIWQAARVPLSAAWIALAATMLALLFAAFGARTKTQTARPMLVASLAGLGLAAAVGAVLLFRGAMDFVLTAITPGAQPAWLAGESITGAIAGRLLAAGAGSALCFLAAIALTIAAIRRGHASFRLVVIVLVVSLGVSAALVANLRSYSDRWHDVTEGRGLHAALPTRD